MIKADDIFYFKENVEVYPLDEKTMKYNENILRVIWAGSPCQYIRTQRIAGKFYHYFSEFGLPYMYAGSFKLMTKEKPDTLNKTYSLW